MKARTDPRDRLSRAELTRLNGYAHDYAAAAEESVVLAFATILNGEYHIGAKRWERLCRSVYQYLSDIRRQQVSDGADKMSDIDCINDAVKRMKILYKKQTGNEWRDIDGKS